MFDRLGLGYAALSARNARLVHLSLSGYGATGPRSVREFFPGADFCADGTFYLHDGTVWSFYKAGFLDE